MFSDAHADHGWSSWRYVPPALLRGACVVGFAAIVVAVISSGFTSVESSSEAQLQAPAPVSPQEGREAQAAAPSGPVLAAVMPSEQGVSTVTPAPVEKEAATIAVPPPVAEPPAEETAIAERPSAPEPAAPAATPIALPDPSNQASAPNRFVWPDAAVHCPRDWIIGLDPARDQATGCGGPAPPLAQQIALAPADQTALADAASRRAGEVMDPQLIAPLPRPRPDPPARVRTATRGRLPPPPNCGDKHAYWRYNSARQPVWYCR